MKPPGITADPIGLEWIFGGAGDVASPTARARGQQTNRRLHRRWEPFDAREKRPVVANTTIARGLTGWCWSQAVLDG